MEITVMVGDKNYIVAGNVVPPIGTEFTAHKHLADGKHAVLEVVRHEWHLEEAGIDEDGNNTNPFFRVIVHTREVKPSNF